MWFWENDHRKSNKIFVAPKVANEEQGSNG